ncbi:MAG TPA: hypothetical protein VGD50_06655 [Candidatus Baltobacteraceae bacterium]
MKLAHGLVGCVLAAAALLAPSAALADHASIGILAGTPGIGLQLGLPLGKKVGLRLQEQSLGANASGFTSSLDSNDNAYAAQLSVHTYTLLVDLHPFGDAFTFSLGAMQPNIQLSGVATADQQGTIFIGGVPFADSFGGELAGSLKWKQTAPYVGIGFSQARPRGGISVGIDVGAAFIGAPAATLSGTGIATIDQAQFEADLTAERESLQKSASGIDVYPVATVGVNYTF